MALRADAFDLGALRLTSGEGRRIEVAVSIDPFDFGGERATRRSRHRWTRRYEVAKTTGAGHAMRLRFAARLAGPCMRCLSPAAPEIEVDAREVSQPGGGEELESPYVADGVLDVRAWARDALALALPNQILCRPECAGLCAICGADLNEAGPEHGHERAPDPRWAKLGELEFDQ